MEKNESNYTGDCWNIAGELRTAQRGQQSWSMGLEPFPQRKRLSTVGVLVLKEDENMTGVCKIIKHMYILHLEWRLLFFVIQELGSTLWDFSGKGSSLLAMHNYIMKLVVKVLGHWILRTLKVKVNIRKSRQTEREYISWLVSRRTGLPQERMDFLIPGK